MDNVSTSFDSYAKAILHQSHFCIGQKLRVVLHSFCMQSALVDMLWISKFYMASCKELLFLYLKLEFQHREQIRSRCLFAPTHIPLVTSKAEFITESKTFFVTGIVIFPFLLRVTNHHRQTAYAEPHWNPQQALSASMEITNLSWLDHPPVT